MVYKAMPTVPASDLRKHQSEIVERIRETPILLTHNGHGAGVLVHPQVWNDVMDIYERWMKLHPATLDVSDALTWEEFQRLQAEVITDAVG
jgi:PHD/YefM family antitoxin component YafN of YafNO toxin-antitoxin module